MKPDPREDLKKLVEDLKRHLQEFQPHETYVDYEAARRFVAGAETFLSGSQSTLDRALGLTKGRGRPKPPPGKHFDLAYRAFCLKFMALEDGKPKTPSWGAVAFALDFEDASDLRKIVERNIDALTKRYVAELVASLEIKDDPLGR